MYPSRAVDLRFVGLAALVIVHLASFNAVADDERSLDCDSLRKTIARVAVKAVDVGNGNEVRVANGTGFFVDPSGLLITAEHLISGLGASVDASTAVIGVQMLQHPGVAFKATVLERNSLLDYMVLQVATEGLNVDYLERHVGPAPKVGEAVRSAGYPDGLQALCLSGAIVAHTGNQRLPRPQWTLSMTTLPGQSGAPVLGSGGRVVAILTASDSESATIALATPVRFIPEAWFAPIDSGGKLVGSGTGSLRVYYDAPTTRVRRERVVEFRNQPCQQAQVHMLAISATEGFGIDVSSVRVVANQAFGLVSSPAVRASAPGSEVVPEVSVDMALANTGVCLSVPSFRGLKLRMEQKLDEAAYYKGVVEYDEVATGATRSRMLAAEISDTAVHYEPKLYFPSAVNPALLHVEYAGRSFDDASAFAIVPKGSGDGDVQEFVITEVRKPPERSP